MQSLRIFQQRTVQQLIRTHPIQTNLQRLRIQTTTLRNSSSTIRVQSRSLHSSTPFSSKSSRSFRSPFRRPTRGFATATAEPVENLSLSQRLKKLSREYGWTALGVYLLLSALDFPFCFLAVRLLGTDRIGHWEHVVVSTVKDWMKWPLSSEAQEQVDGAVHEVEKMVKETIPVTELKDHEKRILEEDNTYAVVDHGYNEAKAANKGSNASLWTQLALAYAIHKSFIFVRVPLTAAVLPKVVKTLRSWGYNIGKMPPKKVGSVKTASGTTGVNTKGSGVKSE